VVVDAVVVVAFGLVVELSTPGTGGGIVVALVEKDCAAEGVTENGESERRRRKRKKKREWRVFMGFDGVWGERQHNGEQVSKSPSTSVSTNMREGAPAWPEMVNDVQPRARASTLLTTHHLTYAPISTVRGVTTVWPLGRSIKDPRSMVLPATSCPHHHEKVKKVNN
jgi:hypothetical protein